MNTKPSQENYYKYNIKDIAEKDYKESSISLDLKETKYHERNTLGCPIISTNEQQQQTCKARQTSMTHLTAEDTSASGSGKIQIYPHL